MINYKFPVINSLDDIKHVLDKKEFILVKKDGYQVLNYAFTDNHTFETPFEAEARGLIFDMDGKILSRRYHKFFNAGEREDVSLEDVIEKMSKMDYQILEKLDGSMVSPMYIPVVHDEAHLRWTTKMGITDVAMQAEAWVMDHPNYLEFVIKMLDQGLTPIFEWCSPNNRIVLDYKKEILVLTAVRNNNLGYYHPHVDLQFFGHAFNIPVVKALDKTLSFDQVRAMEDMEGIVIRFQDGHMVKVKSDWYCKIHKVKDDISSESKVLTLILDEKLDDVLPILPKEDVERVLKYRESSLGSIYVFTMDLIDNYYKALDAITPNYQCFDGNSSQRKAYAEHIKDMKHKSLLFKMFDGKIMPWPIVVDYVKRHMKKLEQVRDIIGPSYKGIDINE